jgi:pilus assembly protein CpaB
MKGASPMRRGSSSLLIIVGIFALLLAGAGTYLYLFSPGSLPGTATVQTAPLPEPDIMVIQAAIDLEPGTLIDDPDELLKTSPIPAVQYHANPEQYFVDPEELRNLKTLRTISANEPMRRDTVAPAGLALTMPTTGPGQPSIKAFPIQVNALSGVADLIQTGDFVDVMASFNMDVTTFRPGVPQQAAEGVTQPAITEQATNEGSVKVLLQDIEVLEIIKPAPPQPTAEGETTPPPPPPEQAQPAAANTAGTTLQSGNWVLVIGVTNQEAEVLRFALDRGIGISTLLRRAGDHTTERTVGSTLRILIDNYGMPVPNSLPPVQQPGPVQVPNVPTLPDAPIENFAPRVTPEAAP